MSQSSASEGTFVERVPEHVRSMRPYEPGKPIEELERELGIEGALKLASNENCLGPSERVIEAVRHHLSSAHRYPDDACFYLARSLAERLGVQPTELVIANGATEVIVLLVRALLRPIGTQAHGGDDEALVSEGSFIMYRLALQAHGVKFSSIPMKDRGYDLETLAEAVTPSTRMVFVANPNNPTGTWVGRGRMERFLDGLPEHVVPVVDEAYFEYVTEPDYPDCLRLRDRHPNLVVLRSFSKVHALAGLRCGYGVMPESLADLLRKIHSPFGVGSAAQVAALAALNDYEHIEASRRLNAEGLRRLISELPRMGIGVTPSAANFVLADFDRPGAEVYQELLTKGVIVRPMAVFGFPNSVRISVGRPEENERLISAFRDLRG